MKKVLFLLAVLVVTAVACTASGGDREAITITDPWGRTSPKVAENGAFYMLITNNGDSDDALLSAASDACGTVELHEMYDMGEGVMGMRPVQGGSIPVPAGGSAELKVGGLHIMCLGKQVEFNVGTEIPLKLTFENAGEMDVTVEIRES
ncbi:MAG: copper chaperone PCu(A)C [Anaerolineaceae bacterium]|nr:copper chaperone PCu(A)C [Anaerolineaceae bacterium]